MMPLFNQPNRIPPADDSLAYELSLSFLTSAVGSCRRDPRIIGKSGRLDITIRTAEGANLQFAPSLCFSTNGYR